MYYAILPTNQDLVHKSHKYVEKRMGRNGKWIYYYTKKPTLKGRAGVYAGEKLEKQQLNSAVKLAKMPNNSREQAEAKMTQRHIENQKIEKARAEYNKTVLGKLEKFASAGMNYLERLGLVSTNTKIATSKTTGPSVPKEYPTTQLSKPVSSIKISKTTTTRKRRNTSSKRVPLRDR